MRLHIIAFFASVRKHEEEEYEEKKKNKTESLAACNSEIA